MLRMILLCLGAVMALSACDGTFVSSKNRVYFDGMYFPARLSTVGADKADFVVTVDRVEQGLVPAREAGRHRAIKHCVTLFGNSNVLWSEAPDLPEGAVAISDDKLVLKGRCDV